MYIGLDESEALSDADVLDPHMAKLWNQAVHDCWLMCNVDFTVTEGWQEFLGAYACGRPLNAALLDGARVAWEVQKQSIERESIFSKADSQSPQPVEQPGPTYQQIDDLDDEEGADQLRTVRLEHAKLLRAGIL